MGPAQLPLVLLDRDGVINRDSAEYIKSAEEWQPLPGSLEAIAALTNAGFTVAVVTNQSGIGRGFFCEETLADIHAKMLSAVASYGGRIADIYHCPHTPDDDCNCRKPRPGLLLQAMADFASVSEADPGAVFIGDKPSDVEAAIAAGAEPVFLGDRETEKVPRGVSRFSDLASAVDALIERFASAA